MSPIQAFNSGIIETTADKIIESLFNPVNEGILPEPLLTNPIAVLLLLHEKVAPTGTLEKTIGEKELPEQTLKLDMTETVGLGLILIE